MPMNLRITADRPFLYLLRDQPAPSCSWAACSTRPRSRCQFDAMLKTLVSLLVLLASSSLALAKLRQIAVNASVSVVFELE
jgi:hypothetical protein